MDSPSELFKNIQREVDLHDGILRKSNRLTTIKNGLPFLALFFIVVLTAWSYFNDDPMVISNIIPVVILAALTLALIFGLRYALSLAEQFRVALLDQQVKISELNAEVMQLKDLTEWSVNHHEESLPVIRKASELLDDIEKLQAGLAEFKTESSNLKESHRILLEEHESISVKIAKHDTDIPGLIDVKEKLLQGYEALNEMVEAHDNSLDFLKDTLIRNMEFSKAGRKKRPKTLSPKSTPSQ